MIEFNFFTPCFSIEVLFLKATTKFRISGPGPVEKTKTLTHQKKKSTNQNNGTLTFVRIV